MAKLTSMINIGKEMENKLNSIDICTAEELIQIGSKESFSRLEHDIQIFVYFICTLFKERLTLLNTTNCLP